MPSMYFFGKTGSEAISSSGISLYRMQSAVDFESTVVFIKSSSLSIIFLMPVYSFRVGSWGIADGSRISSKWTDFR